MKRNNLPKFLMMLVYFLGAATLLSLGTVVIRSGFAGFKWYQDHLGHLIHIPSQELFEGTGSFLIVLGVFLVLAALVEIFYCPACPFPFHRRWQSPTLKAGEHCRE